MITLIKQSKSFVKKSGNNKCYLLSTFLAPIGQFLVKILKRFSEKFKTIPKVKKVFVWFFNLCRSS